jgi:hypothetical protein
MLATRLGWASISLLLLGRLGATDLGSGAGTLLEPPAVGDHQLRVLSPTVLELTWVNSKLPDPARVTDWDLVDGSYQFQPPAANELAVQVSGQPAPIAAVGFKRRPLYAPVAVRDLRIGNYLYLRLASPIATGQLVEVLNPGERLWPMSRRFVGSADPLRYSPAIHVNQEGYVPSFSKKAMVGYYLGNSGEMDIPASSGFQLVDATNGAVVYQGPLTNRQDVGYVYSPTPYQKVWEADFSAFTTPGQYKLVVPGLGASLPFRIDDGVAMGFARAYALGLYHQRCGASNALPFTRHTHAPCHTAPAQVPTMTFTNTQFFLAQASADYTNNPRHTAPQLKDVDSSLYPFVNAGPVDVSGGHHDAGDYSKYTINSAALVHLLMFAVDALPGVAELDNLGLPESGDGLSDVLQEAKREADFLAKMQDADGGFYFLVYPRNRQYESNVLPDQGDPQVVWPKNTAATAAAVAALAQCASSPRFKQHFPAEAALYLQKAQLGWQFLTNAIARQGKDGAYQKLTHYGDDFMHDDELAWAACELYLATGDAAFQQRLFEWFPNPSSPSTWRWGWWKLFGSYGNAIRSYAFATRSGRLAGSQLDATYLSQCEALILAAANDTLRWSQQNAYGTSFPEETKRVRGGGWYFSGAQAFDLVAAYQINSRPEFLDAILANFNYEAGGNPLNVSFVTGLGWKRQREIVHQYAQNDRRVLPPSGIPLGNIQASFDYLNNYKSELGALCFPQDGAATAPYPCYDRWADAFNVTTEFTIVDQGRALAGAAFLAALTPLKTQAWQPAVAQITGLPAEISTNAPVTATLNVPGTSLANARIVWEARGQEPAFGESFTFAPTNHGAQWVEAEVQWPDGRRAFATASFAATNGLPTLTVTATRTNASEAGRVPGEFTVYRAGDTTTALTVNYRLSGTAAKFTDYRRPQGDMPEFVTIPAGAASATITIVPVDDTLAEGTETVILTLLLDPNYNADAPFNATVTIEDNDIAILAIDRTPAGSVQITWTSSPGKTYRVAGRDGFAAPGWTDLSGDITAANVTTTWTDTTADGFVQRFYRVYSVN